jgi:dihydrofolate reductase
MLISFVVAMSENRVIGKEGQVPWHLPKDLNHFKKLTVGKNILMGRKTFEAIGQALPHRHNFVLSRDDNFSANNIGVFHNKEEVLRSNFDELMIIGGEKIYQLFLPECQKIHLTLIHATIDGDTHFPNVLNFNELKRDLQDIDERHAYSYSFIEYIKSSGSA